VTRRSGAWLAAAASLAAFASAFFLRMNAAYGPFNLSSDASDWRVLWDLWRQGQIASDVVAQSALLGAGAAAVPWLVLGVVCRARLRP
jgi:hypothetical protein